LSASWGHVFFYALDAATGGRENGVSKTGEDREIFNQTAFRLLPPFARWHRSIFRLPRFQFLCPWMVNSGKQKWVFKQQRLVGFGSAAIQDGKSILQTSDTALVRALDRKVRRTFVYR